MSRPAKNEMAATELGLRLTDLRSAHDGDASNKAIELWIWAHYEVHLSDESIRRAHNGQVDPNACDVRLLWGLGAFYGVAPDGLGNAAGEVVRKAMAMAPTNSDPTDGGTSDLGDSQSRRMANRTEPARVLPLRSADKQAA